MRLTDPAIARVYYVEAAARAIDVNLPDSLDLDRVREMTFENFDINVPHLRQEERWSLESAYRTAMEFAESPESWLLIFGPNGCGKTHLAAAIANRCRARGERPVFFFVADLLDYLRHLMDRDSGPSFLDGFNQLRNAPLLILDDLGAQSDVALGARPAVPADQPPLRRPPAHRVHGQHGLAAAAGGAHRRPPQRPGVCTEAPITAPAYRVDLRDRPAALGPQPRPAANPREAAPAGSKRARY